MSPQPAAPPAEAEDAKATKEFEDLLKRVMDPKSRAGDTIRRTVELEQERAALMKRITANRDYLRLMDLNEELTDEQANFVEDVYPEKEKGSRRSDDEIEQTRKVKEAIRKVQLPARAS